MFDFNIMAAVVAAISSFVLGGLWYSPALFGKTWCRETGRDMNKPHPPGVFVISLVFALVAAVAFAWLLGPAPELQRALLLGLVVGVAFVAASFGTNYQFAGRGHLLWAIDGGYHTLQFLIFGLILGLWH